MATRATAMLLSARVLLCTAASEVGAPEMGGSAYGEPSALENRPSAKVILGAERVAFVVLTAAATCARLFVDLRTNQACVRLVAFGPDRVSVGVPDEPEAPAKTRTSAMSARRETTVLRSEISVVASSVIEALPRPRLNEKLRPVRCAVNGNASALGSRVRSLRPLHHPAPWPRR